ncbi:OmpA family protein [Caballeronia ptereochthonis]|uniref:OmpA/MotB domain-containing protein n=1 Tax=Caballeronia ptereochthonis TaxID=1777144 RepID=A0A158BST7_9BURK|nr:OmpA family protein [Caballeronia ptereochthonis]SAK73060.1 OmpA/MotB domain-containing protein [Caballeronia ptereochthonis]
MSINLNQLVQGALTESVLQHIAGRIGCAPESAKRVVSLCAPALIGAMMNKASSLEGARNLFAAVMSPATNALIAEELPHFVVQDEGFRTLVENGAKLDQAVASHDSLNVLAERIAEYTGVAASATRTLAGVVCATMLGVLKRHLSQHNGRPDQLPALLGHQLPVVRANMTDAFARALGLGPVGAFLAGVASRLKAVSAHLEHPATQEAAEFPLQSEAPAAEQPAEKENACRKKWWWVALAAALALLAALLGRGCSTTQSGTSEQEAAPAAKPEAASGPVADTAVSASVEASAPVAAPATDSAMSFLVDTSGVPTLTATVSSEAERQRLIDALAAKLGVDKFHANITVDPDTKPAAWIGKLDELLPVMALPGAQVRIAGEQVELSGRAADATLGWADKLKASFGDGWTITASGAAAAQAASGTQTTGACAAGDIANKLKLARVNFGFASNTLPRVALASLAESAKSLKDCHAAGTPIKLQIGGYTDNTGASALNVGLSRKRAQAVRTYLIRHGVPADTLTAEGFGDASPVADNATAAGRSANRRIEFKALS